MLAAVAASSLSFQAPAAGMLMQPRAAVPAMALEDMYVFPVLHVPTRVPAVDVLRHPTIL